MRILKKDELEIAPRRIRRGLLFPQHATALSGSQSEGYFVG